MSGTCEHLKEAGHFLSGYAALLLGCGATCIRIEKNVGRMARSCGLTADLVILPADILLTVRRADDSHISYTCTTGVRKTSISFFLNTELSKLSWLVAEGKMNMREAAEQVRGIGTGKVTDSRVMLFLVAAANASFCRLFGGDGVAMSIVFVATLAGFLLKQCMLADGADVRLTTFLSAFFAAVAGSAGYVFGWGTTPELALGTSVLFLIPGIPYINSMSDLLDGHYLCSFCRFMYAAVQTVCISLGLCGALLLMNQRIL